MTRTADPSQDDGRRRWKAPGLAAVLLLCLAATAMPAQAAAPCGEGTTVAAGDTLSAIASRCGTSVEALRRANPQVTDPRRLRVGMHLQVPDGSPPDTEAASGGAAPAPRRASNRDGLTDTAVRPPPRGVQSLFLEQQEGPPGSQVTLRLSGLPPGPALLGAGIRQPRGQVTNWERLQVAEIPAEGSREVHLALPRWARPGDELAFVVQAADDGLLESGNFRILPPPDLSEQRDSDQREGEAEFATPEFVTPELHASGRLVQGEDCLLLQTGQGHLYGVTSRTWTLIPGAEISLAGTPADAPPCDGTRGTLEVAEIRPAPAAGEQ